MLAGSIGNYGTNVVWEWTPLWVWSYRTVTGTYWAAINSLGLFFPCLFSFGIFLLSSSLFPPSLSTRPPVFSHLCSFMKH